MALIESISGVRGVVPQDLTDAVAARYARAFDQWCTTGPLLVGRDSRPSGASLSAAVIDALLSSGRDVTDCSIAPTPTIQFLAQELSAAGAVVITASHNPAEWNGLKFIASDGCFLNAAQMADVLGLVGGGRDSAKSAGQCVRLDGGIRRHVTAVVAIDFLRAPAIRDRRFRVAVDAVNGAASAALPHLLQHLGCDVVTVHCEPSGDFPRGTEPLPQNLGDLCRAVREERCAVGFATDPDGDRLAVADETGRPIGEELTLVLATQRFLEAVPGPHRIATNLSTTQLLDWVVRTHKGAVVRTPVGEIHVVEEMKRIGGRLGGEGNGGVILRDVHLGRDSLVAAAMILDLLAGATEPLSALVSRFPSFHVAKERLSLGSRSADAALEAVATAFPSASVDRRDGVKLIWPDRWVHVRKSNTEPIVRIYAEAPTEGEASSLANEAIAAAAESAAGKT